MGAFHEGHLSLVRASCERAGVTVVSIFVNPTQFGPDDDFDEYPRDIERDLELLAAEGVDFVFTPSVDAMYAPDASVTVTPGVVARRWEGESRPGHFEGVATIVVKLLNVVRPDVAFFGEKDYQQLRVIEDVVAELDMPVTVVACPTIRESDGLAMSSRNAYLSAEERETARALSSALEAAAECVVWGERDVGPVESAMADTLAIPSLDVEYAVVVDSSTLEPVEAIRGEARALIAARVGQTRLIDNAPLAISTDPATHEEAE
jgi:pantoate--beta-alanine ligase